MLFVNRQTELAEVNTTIRLTSVHVDYMVKCFHTYKQCFVIRVMICYVDPKNYVVGFSSFMLSS